MDLKATLIELQCEMVAERSLVNPKEITWLQYDILYQVEKEGKILPSGLSLILGVSRTKLSKALKELKTMGYIEQIPNKLDGRELYTFLTDSGKDLLINISRKHMTLYEIAIKSFTNEEQENFIDLSNKFSKELRKARIRKDE
ncbi:MarR family transcriptional regulator [Anaerococcus sp. AGMB00486]|uniref:MarR family transcriptional regulator n=1 Tax=Anaerococcus faecalis TaxID=2742993 RepID=A0ABX2N9T8_9FIRM|nr:MULTISPECIES: MarR family transcriptional regulator [Anaerococcus]MCI5839415.1 MarR family transcriptional regulator [Peptoniphilaceae bacterium]MDY3007316.1 MarR family transcriptional regulator [Anaerococcus porci]MDY3737574.1 MarR family transcriptional regulator [Peptoniphilaceae bacterium]NVF11464.1 MarR family transcriptional regulator [Anaerococcus faecalis]